MTHVTAILVAYNSERVIARAIAALLQQPPVKHIIVVDNCSTDNTCELIRRDFPSVTVIENPRNEGFGRANNIGLKKTETPFALLVNPDAVLERGAAETLLTAATRYPDATILAPELRAADGTVHHSYKRDVFDREASKDNYADTEGDCCADFLSGAVWLLNMNRLRSVGFFDPNIFLYYEDDDLCLRVRGAGHGLVFVPSAKAVHLMGESSGLPKPESEFFKQKQMIWSRLYIEEKYRGDRAAFKLASSLRRSYAFKAALYCLIMDKEKINRYRGRLAGVYEFTETARPAKAA